MIGNDWDKLLEEVFDSNIYKNIYAKLKKLYKEKEIFPKQNDLFNAFKLTSFKDVKVVIVGQDPYHGINQAHGLAFSVQDGIKFPPSLLNIFKELNEDLGISIPKSGNLTKWAKEGVLLINSVLTVEKDKPESHYHLNWEYVTDNVLQTINDNKENVVFILWGKKAELKKEIITNKKHLVLIAPHPSPLSAYRGFFGSKPFSKTNVYLKQNNIQEINWKL